MNRRFQILIDPVDSGGQRDCMRRPLHRLLNSLAIEHLTPLWLIVTLLVSFLNQENPIVPGILTLKILTDSHWWRVLLFPFLINESYYIIFIYLYFLYIFGTALNEVVGKVRFNLFMLIGTFLIMVGAFLFPGRIDSTDLYLSLILAVGFKIPDMELSILFMFPLRVKWIAIPIAIFMVGRSVLEVFAFGTFFPLMGPVFAFGNVLIFFGREMVTLSGRKAKSKHQLHKIRTSRPDTIHRCAVCGLTEADDPYMDFRFCVECDDREYCRDHLHNHEHIKR